MLQLVAVRGLQFREGEEDRWGELTARDAVPPPYFTASAQAAEGPMNQLPQRCGSPWQSKPWLMCSEMLL